MIKMVFYTYGSWSAFNMVQVNGFSFMLKLNYFYHGPCSWCRETPLIKVFAILAPQADHYSSRLLNQSPPMKMPVR